MIFMKNIVRNEKLVAWKYTWLYIRMMTSQAWEFPLHFVWSESPSPRNRYTQGIDSFTLMKNNELSKMIIIGDGETWLIMIDQAMVLKLLMIIGNEW